MVRTISQLVGWCLDSYTLRIFASVARHVADILRDKLHSLGVELIDSKARVSNLENVQALDRGAVLASNGKLSEASADILFYFAL